MPDPIYQQRKHKASGEQHWLRSDDDGATWERDPAYQPPPADAPAPSTAASPPPQIGAGEAFGRGAGSGASMGFGDEAAGFGGWLAGQDADFRGREDFEKARVPRGAAGFSATPEIQSDYRAEQSRYQGEDDAAEEQHGTAYGLGMGLGVAGTAALPLGNAAKGATWGQRAARAAPAAAAWGGLGGLGGSREDTASGKFFDTLAGAEMGGVGGSVLGEGVHQLLTRYSRPLRSFLRELPGLGGQAQANRYIAKIREMHGDEAAEMAARMIDDSPEGAELRRLVTAGESPDTLLGHQEAVSEGLSDVVKTGDRVRAEEGVAGKHRAIAEHLDAAESAGATAEPPRWMPPPSDTPTIPAPPPKLEPTQQGARPSDLVEPGHPMFGKRGPASDLATLPPPRDTIGDIEAILADEYQVNEDSAVRTAINRSRRAIETYRNKAADPAAKGALANDFETLDQLKRELQREASGLAKRRRRDSIFIDQSAAEPIRQMLLDEERWGKAAVAIQRRENEAWSARLKAAKGERGVLEHDIERSKQTPYVMSQRANREGVFPLVDSVGDPKMSDKVSDFEAMLRSEGGLQRAMTEHRPPGDALSMAAGRSSQTADSIMERISQRRAESGAAEGLKAAETGLRSGGFDPSAAAAATPKSGFLSEAMGLLRGQAPTQTGRELGRLEAQASAGNRSAQSGVNELLMRPREIPQRVGTREQVVGMTGRTAATSGQTETMSDAREQLSQSQQAAMLALADPQYGAMLQAQEPQEQEVTIEILSQTDTEFRRRQRERAQQTEQQETDR